jgi:cell division protein FtsB
MLVRSRARALIAPLLIYLVLGSASAYLVKNAARGQNGAEARAAFDREQATLKTQLADLEDQRDRWRHRVESLRNESIDRDLLEQEAHARLNRVNKEEVLIFTAAQVR